MRIVLDTNFLIYSVKYRLMDDLEKEGFELVLLESVENELKKLSKSGKERENAKIALELLKRMRISKEKTEISNVDRSIADFARRELEKGREIAVGTMDKGLEKRLKSHGIKTLKIRRKKTLILG